MDSNFNMTFEESQDYISRRGFDIPWNDCDVFVDEREIDRTVGNVLKWADKTMIDKACEILKNVTVTYNKRFFGKCEENAFDSDFIKEFRQAMEE